MRLCTSPEPTDLPNVKLVEAYCSDSSNPGPSLPDPAILWTHPMSHPWNETIIDMIADAFLTCLRADESTEPQFLKPAFVRTALIAKLKPIGVKLRKQLPRPLGPVESAEEMQSRLQTEQETMKKAKRRRERRSNVSPHNSRTPYEDKEVIAIVNFICAELQKTTRAIAATAGGNWSAIWMLVCCACNPEHARRGWREFRRNRFPGKLHNAQDAETRRETMD